MSFVDFMSVTSIFIGGIVVGALGLICFQGYIFGEDNEEA